jgi:hypothetical protein
MRPALDYSKDIRRKLADGKTLDDALTELRTGGASIFDCIVSVRTFRRCEIAQAKRIVETSSAWSDHRNVTEEVFKVWSESDDKEMAQPNGAGNSRQAE